MSCSVRQQWSIVFLMAMTVENDSLVLVAHLWQKHLCLMLDFSLHNKHVTQITRITLSLPCRGFSPAELQLLWPEFICLCVYSSRSHHSEGWLHVLCCCLFQAGPSSTCRATELPSWSCISRVGELFFTLFWGLKESLPFSGNWKNKTNGCAASSDSYFLFW